LQTYNTLKIDLGGYDSTSRSP